MDRSSQSNNRGSSRWRLDAFATAQTPAVRKLLGELKESQPCAVSGALQVSLLYGREHALYLDDNANLKMDVEGLVFKKP